MGRLEREKEIRAEAAAWLARIRSDQAVASDIADFQRWLAEDKRHRRAFDAVTAVWEDVGGVRTLGDAIGSVGRPQSAGRVVPRRVVLAGAGVVAAAFGLWQFRRRDAGMEIYATEVGEQRRVALADGSLAILDTDSRIGVAFNDETRTVHQLGGRVFFEVAHDPAHPFVVDMGKHSVTALGTSFDVERSAAGSAVVLVSGQVRIRSAAELSPQPDVELRAPGDRIVFTDRGVSRRDTLNLSVATAWQTGRAVFDDEPLADAVAEINRYSRRPIVLASDVSQLRISGNYGTGDTEAFATSLTTLYPMTASYESGRIVLRATHSGNVLNRN